MPINIPEVTGGAAGADCASDLFLHVQTKRAGKIQGECATDGHVHDIGLVTWGWGVSANTAIGSTARTARRMYKHLVVTKGIDTASTGLLSTLVSNDEVKEAKLTMRKAGGAALDYYTMTLSDARVIAVDVEVAADGRPVERVAFAFTRINVEYQLQDDTGSGTGSYTFDDEVMAAT